ncbi:2Fe-2S iron-sulfur cluster-binding protein [Rubrolithibacter danxiaensis]|uniref:2Fe-2S iron-sulfur cluster-binding protein n=1 Tax=Rubrolithibacter danxiaensis TaxID=3390805 RepID=UPI003BF85069
MEEILAFTITTVKEETADAKTFLLQPHDPLFHFVPGQFLTFIIELEKKELRRSYSIVSLPGEPLKITVQRVENGAISRYLLMHWKQGDVVKSLPPAGRFVLSPQNAYPRDIFFLAAGSGITPVLPQVRYLLQQEPQSNIFLFYSNNTEDKILFLEEIEQLQARYKRFYVFNFLSNPKSQFKERQRLNNGILEKLITEKLQFESKHAVFMVCGPFTYMRMVTLTLVYMKFDEEQIKTENFLPVTMRSDTRRTPDFPDRAIRIKWKGKQYTVLVKNGQTILRAALAAGFNLPYSCEGGICSACSAICTSGKVKMTINEVLTSKDLKNNWVLTCTGYPADEAVILEFPE